MNYFATGARPTLLQFPPCVSRLTLPHPSTVSEGSSTCDTDRDVRRSSALKEKTEPAPDAGHAGRDDKHTVKAPAELHQAFSPEDVRPWEPGHFEMIEKVQDAVRNRGQVDVMRDAVNDRLVAVKRMPNDWVQNSHSDFVQHYPMELEQPWQDIGCNHFLSTHGYAYGCQLLGVYRGEEHTAVVTELASEGDLFSWCGVPTNADPGPGREALLRPLAVQIVRGVQQLHEMAIVHRDLSLENLVMSKGEADEMQVRVIDFGMASTARHFRSSASGKPSYMAPELHTEGDYDAFLSDAFAIGVSLYAAFVKDYPWLSTKPRGCKCFEFFRKNGFRRYIAKRKLRGVGGVMVADVMSEDLVRLLEGLLAPDPAQRLTLGESSWEGDSRRSVWDEPWLGGSREHGSASC